MPVYLPDTNIISYWMRGDSGIIQKIRSCSPSDLSLSTVTLAEIYYGIEKSPARKKERRMKIERIKSQLAIFPFSESAALIYGRIRPCLFIGPYFSR
jgi:tRNA(fMet)-specific endonuclease VapC